MAKIFNELKSHPRNCIIPNMAVIVKESVMHTEESTDGDGMDMKAFCDCRIG